MKSTAKLRENIESYRQLIMLSVISGVFSLILGGVVYFFGVKGRAIGLQTFKLAMIPAWISFLLCVFTFIQGKLGLNASREEEEKYLLKERKADQSAFDVESDVRFTAYRSYELFMKYSPYIVAVGILLISGIMLLLTNTSWKLVPKGEEFIKPTNPMNSLLLCLILLISTLFACMFLVGQSRDKRFRWLKAVGAWYVVFLVIQIIAGISAVCFTEKFNAPKVDFFLTYKIISPIIIVLMVEQVLIIITEFYRPRTTEEVKPVFESRILTIFTEPGGMVRNISETLDYQFGFKVSKTWIYSFVEKSLFPLILVWLFLLWIFSSIFIVESDEVGFRENLGKLAMEDVKKPLQPGFYLKYPYPFGKIRVFKTQLMPEISIGPKKEVAEGHNSHGNDKILWVKQHYAKEPMFLLATETDDLKSGKASDRKLVPVSQLAANMALQYRVKPDGFYDYAYKNKNTPQLLKNIADSVATQYLASSDLIKIMSSDREKAADYMIKEIQKRADEQQLGVNIVTVNIHDVHPEASVAVEFQNVVSAREKANKLIIEAETEKMNIETSAKIEEYTQIQKASAYKNSVVQVARSESKRFENQLQAYKISPNIYMLRTYLDFLENDLKNVRKFVVSEDLKSSVYEINLEEKTRLDSVSIPLEDMGK
ncbi:protease modulator HflK [Lentisphaerota bacterium WC36G]|nr:protease modulator HflK [Lentisphaerae bacterium WC36]